MAAPAATDPPATWSPGAKPSDDADCARDERPPVDRSDAKVGMTSTLLRGTFRYASKKYWDQIARGLRRSSSRSCTTEAVAESRVVARRRAGLLGA